MFSVYFKGCYYQTYLHVCSAVSRMFSECCSSSYIRLNVIRKYTSSRLGIPTPNLGGHVRPQTVNDQPYGDIAHSLADSTLQRWCWPTPSGKGDAIDVRTSPTSSPHQSEIREPLRGGTALVPYTRTPSGLSSPCSTPPTINKREIVQGLPEIGDCTRYRQFRHRIDA